ncbi:MAG: M55 family metallopeptidase [Candidatus Aminicenantes bacterium]|nr:M55 family metallopeptidase [Candidatus Aminicenantes bacterium]
MKFKKACRSGIVVMVLAFIVSCTPEKAGETSHPGRILLEPATDTDGLVKILLYYDMEGVSGQNVLRSIDFGNDDYFQAREWLTDDVNAVIDGLFMGGADAVDVVDAHGSFNPEPDILLDRMDSRAAMMYKDKPFRPYVDLVEEGRYDAIVLVCMHSKTGGGGFASHTINFGMDWILNDMSLNESEIFAYSWGRVRTPLIFVSGDDRLEEQLAWMSWLEYVRVKKARGADNAELRPAAEVHKEMRESAERSVRNIARSKAVRLKEPIKAQLRAVPPADLSALESVPGLNYHDQTAGFTAATFLEAYDGIRGLMRIAWLGYFDILMNSLFQNENGRAVFNGFKEELFTVWADVESGRWLPPAPPEIGTPAKKYFGSQ